MSRPPGRSRSMAAGTTSGTPAASTTTSAPRPPLSPRTCARRSSSVVSRTSSVTSAPSSRANASRSGDRSMAMIVPAPSIRALITWHSPSGPTP